MTFGNGGDGSDDVHANFDWFFARSSQKSARRVAKFVPAYIIRQPPLPFNSALRQRAKVTEAQHHRAPETKYDAKCNHTHSHLHVDWQHARAYPPAVHNMLKYYIIKMIYLLPIYTLERSACALVMSGMTFDGIFIMRPTRPAPHVRMCVHTLNARCIRLMRNRWQYTYWRHH